MAEVDGRWPVDRWTRTPQRLLTLGGSCGWCWWTTWLAGASLGRLPMPQGRKSASSRRMKGAGSNLASAGGTSRRGARSTILELVEEDEDRFGLDREWNERSDLSYTSFRMIEKGRG